MDIFSLVVGVIIGTFIPGPQQELVRTGIRKLVAWAKGTVS